MAQFVAIKEMSAGNDTVGEMWKETKIFNEDATVKEVMLWAGGGRLRGAWKKNITITLADEDFGSKDHICEGCGGVGWTGKCSRCIPW